MRDGYQLDQRGPTNTVDLVAPNGKSIARVNRNTVDVIAIIESYEPEIVAPNVNDEAELDNALDAMAEEHYQLTTTRQDRFHDRRKKFLADPIWRWLAFLLAVVVAAVGWMS